MGRGDSLARRGGGLLRSGRTHRPHHDTTRAVARGRDARGRDHPHGRAHRRQGGRGATAVTLVDEHTLRTEIYAGGTWRGSSDDSTFDVLDPSTEAVLATVANGTVADALACVAA